MESGGAVQGQAEGQGQAQAAGAGGGRSGWQMLRSILFQMVIFYFITSFFRGRQQPPPADPEGRHPAAGANLFPKGQEMELSVYLTEWEDFNVSRDHEGLVWNEDLVYGDSTSGPVQDGSRSVSMDVSVPESVQQNGTWYLHVLLVKFGFPLDPEDEDYSEQAITHTTRLFNKYRKRHLHNTVNLITGEADVAPGSLKVPQGATDIPPEVVSYFHPNLTINLVDDHTRWVPGSIPQPMDKFVEFDFESGGYFPILYINDYWNLAQEYMPLNDTTPSISITLSFMPITMFKFNMYAAMSRDNPWYGLMSGADQTDEEQDSIKQTLLETNPYLLGLTVAVSILHSVFEFLAFKNDVQFWRSRKTLEGLSVRSVFFNVFQSLIVLLYILDNETNFVIIISVFIGLLIELWKVTKVVEIRIDRENMIAGVLPRISFTDRPSYQSSTKKYDMMAFKYLGIVLFPLFIGYGVYALLYLEHKGWLCSVCHMGFF
jgi:hypothetical protein